ncbi:MAG: glycosyltransferase family 4 protein [Anaerolineales bacterium]|nr:glycosyltransferase family 4 protein [Anaerolineales bacterium]
MSQKLRQQGVDARVITRSGPGLTRSTEVGGVPLERVGRGRGGKLVGGPSFVVEAVGRLYAQRRDYDVLHTHMMFSAMTIGLLTHWITGKPLIVNPHGRGPHGDVGKLIAQGWLGRARLAAARRSADAFVCISPAIHEELRGMGAPAARLWDIPNGVDIDHFQPVAGRGDGTRLKLALGLPAQPAVVFAGRLAPVKGVEVLLRAWPEVLQAVPAAQLIILGEGELRAALETHSTQSGLKASVRFIQGCHDVAPYLQAADAFVLPSYSEGSPVALLEAMACGRPCVATANVGNLQVLTDNVTGRLVPVGEAGPLAAGLVEALREPSAAAWGERARAEVVQRYSLDTVAARYVALYQALVRREARPA